MLDDHSILLDDYNANTLREMAEANGISTLDDRGKKLTKEQLLANMRTDFFTAERILASYQHLSKGDRAVLDRLLLRGGQAPTHRFKRELSRAGLAVEAPESKSQSKNYYYRSDVPYGDGYIGDPSHTKSNIFEDIMARLTYRGLVFSRSADMTAGGAAYKLRFHPAAELYIPQVIQDILPTPDPVAETVPEFEPAETLTVDPTLFLRDMYLYWDFVRRNDVDLLNSGLVGKRALKAINDTLLTPDPMLDEARREDLTGRLYLLRLLLEALGLARLEQSKLKPAIKSALQIPPFWQKSQAEQIGEILACWQKLSGFQDIIADELKQYGANFTSARQAVLNALNTLPPNRWLEPVELLEQIQFSKVDFFFSERSMIESAGNRSYYYSRYSSSYYYGQPKTLLATFDRLEAAMIDACLSGVLFHLGLVELGRLETKASPERPWSVFRLTPLGLHIFKQKALPSFAEHTGKLLVQPNFQVMVIGPVRLDILARLDLFAAREQADRGAFQYRLTRESVYQAQQLGLSAAEITKILVQEAGQDSLPQNVQRSLDEWGSHHERIVFRQGVSLLQTANAGLLNRLLAEPGTANLLARPVADDVALVSPKKQAGLVEALMAQSLLPAVSGADPQAADRSVFVQADGVIEPIHAVPSLHLRGRLAQLAEEGAAGRWRLTPASVRRAGGSKRKVLQILTELEKLHRGKLPEPVAVMVKKWGGYYGRAAVETLTLIEFSSREIVAELLGHPRLKDYLTPFATNDRALVVVAPAHLEQVKNELADLGIVIKDGLGIST